MDFYENHIEDYEAYIYNLSGALWNELKINFNGQEKFIATNKFIDNMTKKSIVFICIPVDDVLKIIAVCVSKSDLVKNYDKIKIFNYEKLNENIIEVDKIVLLTDVVIDQNNKLYGKLKNDNVIFKKIEKNISKKIYNLINSKNIIEENDDKSTKTIRSIRSNKSTKSTRSIKSNKSEEISNVIRFTVGPLDNFDINSIKEYKEKKNKIPIKIYKCSKFEWTTPKRKYFKNHLINCKKCVIINNNTTELTRIIDNCIMNIHNIDEENVDDILNSFDCSIQTNTFKCSKHSHINIYDFKKDNFLLIDWYHQ